MIPLDMNTPYGRIIAIHSRGGERTYTCVDSDEMVTTIPEEILKEELYIGSDNLED